MLAGVEGSRISLYLEFTPKPDHFFPLLFSFSGHLVLCELVQHEANDDMSLYDTSYHIMLFSTLDFILKP